ncbi:MAG TPA: hypothetical protein VGD42_16575 [Lysobacter sp.]
MTDPRPPGLLQRSALGLWFFGLSVLGLLRVLARYARDPHALADPVMQVWLVGSALLGVVGVWLLARAIAGRRGR